MTRLRLNCALLTILFPQKLKPKAQENDTEKLSRGSNNHGRVSGRNQSLRRWSIERERKREEMRVRSSGKLVGEIALPKSGKKQCSGSLVNRWLLGPYWFASGRSQEEGQAGDEAEAVPREAVQEWTSLTKQVSRLWWQRLFGPTGKRTGRGAKNNIGTQEYSTRKSSWRGLITIQLSRWRLEAWAAF